MVWKTRLVSINQFFPSVLAFVSLPHLLYGGGSIGQFFSFFNVPLFRRSFKLPINTMHSVKCFSFLIDITTSSRVSFIRGSHDITMCGMYFLIARISWKRHLKWAQIVLSPPWISHEGWESSWLFTREQSSLLLLSLLLLICYCIDIGSCCCFLPPRFGVYHSVHFHDAQNIFLFSNF